MAGRRSNSLVLDVSADVSKLPAGVRVARSALLELQQGAESVEAAVRQSFNDMMPIESVRRAEREFDRIFKSIRANAQAVLAEGNGKTALQLFDVGAADEQVRSLTANAAQLRQWAAAAEAASREGGQFAARQQQIAVALQAEAVQLEQQALALDETATAFRGIQAQIGATDAATKRSTAIDGQKRAGLQQLSFQLNDVAVQFAAGTPPAIIFAQQIGQVTQAVGLLSNKTTGLIGFLGGPWGIGISSALVVLTPFVAKLWEGADATEAVDLASDGLSDAQGILGKVFDLTTGKIKNQTEALVAHARAALVDMQIQGRADLASSGSAMDRIERGNAHVEFQGMPLGPFGLTVPVPTSVSRRVGFSADIVNAYRDGSLRIDEAQRGLQSLRQTGMIDDAELKNALHAITTDFTARDNIDYATTALSSLDSGTLDPSLRQTDTHKAKPERDDSAQLAREKLERARGYEDQVSQAQSRELKANEALATTEEERFGIHLQLLAGEREGRSRELQRQLADKEITQVQFEFLSALNERSDLLEEQNDRQAHHQRLLDEQLEDDQAELHDKAALLDLQGQMATTLQQRRDVALQLLEYELEERRIAAKRLLQSEDKRDVVRGRKDLAQIDREEPLRREQIQDEYADPLERYIDGLQRAVGGTEELNESLDKVRADGLESLEDGLVAVISGTESVGKAFKKMANQIIADLVRIAVQKLILSVVTGGPLGFLGLREGDVPGFASGLIRGPGTGTSDSIFAVHQSMGLIRVSNGESIITAEGTRRHGPLLRAINDGLPAFADGAVPHLAQLPPFDRLRASGRSVETIEQHFHVDAKGSVLAAELVSEMRRIGAAAAIGGSQMAQAEIFEQQASTLF